MAAPKGRAVWAGGVLGARFGVVVLPHQLRHPKRELVNLGVAMMNTIGDNVFNK